LISAAGEAYSAPQITQLYLRGPFLSGGRRIRRRVGKGKGEGEKRAGSEGRREVGREGEGGAREKCEAYGPLSRL